MSNKTNQSVLVNDTSSYYLKQYAALQFPGSVDNFGTKTPIHLLQQQEESEHSVSLREACDSDYDLDGAQFLFEGATYDSVTDLVKDNLCLDDEESIRNTMSILGLTRSFRMKNWLTKRMPTGKTSAIFVIRTVSTRWPTMSICTPRQAGMIQQMISRFCFLLPRMKP